MAPTIVMPEVPVLGLPEGTKQTGRVDFRADKFDIAIETKGYLLLWERAALCPCSPVVIQTEQPDPNCSLCKGRGWLYFGANIAQDLSAYTLTDLQRKMIADTGGMLIRGIITSITSRQDQLGQVTNWVSGTANLTVRHQNKIGYYDKLTLLDSEIIYSEVLVTDGTNILPTRYPVVNVDRLRSVATVYSMGVHYQVENGVITWLPGYIPDADIRVSIHYICHPAWLVVEHPHASRVTLQNYKTSKPNSPLGNARLLPIQALIRYDFLPELP
jgi:hypothetical protein